MNKNIGIRKITNILYITEFSDDKKEVIKAYITEITSKIYKSPQYIVEFCSITNMVNILDNNLHNINSLYISEMKF